MPLSDDQRAMLQLLLQQGQRYEDIASLLGLEVEQVRSRAREALTEIGGEDPDREVSLTDYLLGQADPIGRADAARQLQSDDKARDLAERLATQLRVLAPGAELPDRSGADSGAPKRAKAQPAPAATRAPGEGAASTPDRGAPTGLASTLSKRQLQVIAGLVGGGVVILLAILAIAGVFSGDGDDSSASTDQGSGQAANNASGLTRAELTPQDGSDAEGVAVFARVRTQPVLQVNVFGLDPTGRAEAYLVWLYGSDRAAYPIGIGTAAKGQIRDNFPIPTTVLQAVQEGILRSVDVSLATQSQVQRFIQRVRQNPRSLPGYAGRSVVRGPITGPGFPVSQSSG